MLRVAAYCRVSTDSSDQANSFESQQRFFQAYIHRNPEWELVSIFADEGISGTNTKKRKEFNRMISQAKAGRMDLILTKEVSRFARNTVDTLQYTRDLKRIGVYVLFMNDNINTRDPDAELRLTIMASIAQEESRKTSERIKWGQKRRMEQGVVFGRDMLGYDVRGGHLYINQDGAETVRMIFHKFLDEGKGTHIIARELREAGIETSTHMKDWSNTVILRVLRNEKYCGDLVQKKTYTPDYLSHEKKRNLGQEEYVVLRNHHEPIISREIFELAQKELERRSPSPEQKAKYSNRYCLSGKIQCGCCGSHFVSRTRRRSNGSQYRAWRCYEATKHGLLKTDSAGNHIGCAINCQIRDEDFLLAIQSVVKHLRFNREQLISNLMEIVEQVVSASDLSCEEISKLRQKLDSFTEKRARLLDMYLSYEISKDEYRRMIERYEDDADGLRKRIAKAKAQNQDQAAGKDEILEDIAATVRALALGEMQDDTFYRNIVDKIVVHKREHMDVYLNQLPHKWSFAMS